VLLLGISIAVSVFLIVAIIMVSLSPQNSVDARLAQIGSRAIFTGEEQGQKQFNLSGLASMVTSVFKPIRDLITSNDDDLTYRLGLAGFRKPEHVEIYAAAKMLLPVFAIGLASLNTGNLIAGVLVGAALGFFAPDLFVTQLVARRRERIRLALPDAIDLLMICMEAGLGIDQAMVRVGEEIRLSSQDLADEFLIVNREQRAGKPRVEAWRDMAHRLDIDYVRQFVTMLVQTERFGTPIAQSLGQFADGLRIQRTQAAEERAAKTGVKLLFPMVLFIFPAIFVVVLLPAVLNISKSITEFLK
jgi:tight adherence protein C